MKLPKDGCSRRLEASTEIMTTRDLSLLVELRELENRCFRTYYTDHRFDESTFRYYLKNDRAINVVAKRGNEVIGYALGIALRRSRKHLARLYSVAVAPHWRRRRVGRRMVEQFVSAAMAMGCRVVIAEIAVRNRAAFTLFKRVGFRRDRRLPDYYGAGIDGVRARLQLRNC